jgi:TPR repeat protein
MFANGHGVPQDDGEAKAWFLKAANQGYPPAQFALGVMYREGRGVQQDNIRAYLWFNLSAARGNEKAAKALDSLEQRMTPTQLADAQKQWSSVRSALITSDAGLIPEKQPNGQETENCANPKVEIPVSCLPKTNVPFEVKAKISSSIRNDAEVFDTLTSLVIVNGFRCDSISFVSPFIFSSGYYISCNENRYRYEIADKGGNWRVTVK